MPSGLDQITEALKKHKVAALGIGAAFATAETKAGAIGMLLKEWAIWKMIGPLGMVLGAFKGIEGVVRSIVKDTGSLDAALRKLGQIQDLTRSFTAIKGSVAAAKKEVADLIAFTNGQKLFNLEISGAAAKELEVLTRGSYSGAEALRTVGDAAAATGAPLDGLARMVGEFHEALGNGAAVKTTADALERMGVLSQGSAARLDRMQQSGAGVSVMLTEFNSQLARHKGATDGAMKSVDGITAAYESARKALQEKFGAPFTESENKRMQEATEILKAISGPVGELGKYLQQLTGSFSGLGARVTSWLNSMGLLEPAMSVAVKGVRILISGLTALGAVFTIKAAGPFLSSLWSMVTAADKATVATLSLSQAQIKATASVAALRAGNLGAAASLAGAAGASTGTAAAYGAAALAAKGLALATRLLGVALKGLGIGIAITAIVELYSAFDKWYHAQERAVEGSDKLRAANNELNNSLLEQIANIQTLEDAQNALAKSSENLANARKKLAVMEEMRAAERELGEVSKSASLPMFSMEDRRATDARLGAAKERMAKARSGLKEFGIEETPSQMELDQQRDIVRSTATTRRDLATGINAGAYGASEEERRLSREKASRTVDLEARARQEQISRTSGYGKAGLMLTEAYRLNQEADAGEEMARERARINAEERTARSNLGPGDLEGQKKVQEQFAAVRKGSSSEIIREEQAILEAREEFKKSGGRDPKQLKAINDQADALAVKRERFESNIDQKKRQAADLNAVVPGVIQEARSREIDIEAEKEILALKEQGFAYEEKAAAIRMKALEEQKKLLRPEQAEELSGAGRGSAEERSAARKRELEKDVADARQKGERDLAAIRSEGLQRAEDEARIRKAALEEEGRLIEGINDDRSNAIDDEIAGIEQSLDLTRKQADLERQITATVILASQKRSESDREAIKGDFAKADRLAREATMAEDAIANRQSFESKKGEMGPEKARAAVAAEQQARDARRENERSSYRQESDREQEIARLKRKGAPSSKVRAVINRQALEDEIQAAPEGIPAEEKVRRATEKVRMDIEERGRQGPETSSLTRIGLGGAAPQFSGLDIAREQRNLQADANKILDQIKERLGPQKSDNTPRPSSTYTSN